ncbi:hypothetical protein EJ03DRAFT_379253 [Teratosphaeria nubilosa]|uniref:Uncharacterized protein n=1 Tax=Teratosphaeria nubilosa TaxID=161662 RepID=A0A6G1KSJ6_9PEZI|nr:hypothetical protein EJ03DRAFT_379253 [Teratosphaeria nubilosa]
MANPEAFRPGTMLSRISTFTRAYLRESEEETRIAETGHPGQEEFMQNALQRHPVNCQCPKARCAKKSRSREDSDNALNNTQGHGDGNDGNDGSTDDHRPETAPRTSPNGRKRSRENANSDDDDDIDFIPITSYPAKRARGAPPGPTRLDIAC